MFDELDIFYFTGYVTTGVIRVSSVFKLIKDTKIGYDNRRFII